MINRSTYLGIPVRQRRNRRLLVVAYWAVVFLSLALVFGSPVLKVLSDGKFSGNVGNRWIELLGQILAGLLFGYLTTCLGGVSGRGLLPEWDGPFDERDIRLRNAAHFEAYRIFRMIIFPIALMLAIVFGTIWSRYQRFSGPLLMLLWFLVFSLPQSLILWFEPDMEEPNED